MFEFWNQESRLVSSTLGRLTQLLAVLYSSSSEQHFLCNSTSLLLELTSRSPDYGRSIFDQPLSDCKFEVRGIFGYLFLGLYLSNAHVRAPRHSYAHVKCTHTFIFTRTCTVHPWHIYSHICASTHSYAGVCTDTCTIHPHTHQHTHTHTQTQTIPPSLLGVQRDRLVLAAEVLADDSTVCCLPLQSERPADTD